MKNKTEEKIVIEVFAKGQSKDHVGGKSFTIEAQTVRFNPYALNEWIRTDIINQRECYNTWEEWDAYRKDREQARKKLENEIAKIMGLDTKKAPPIIEKVTAEIFTVVQIWKNKKVRV